MDGKVNMFVLVTLLCLVTKLHAITEATEYSMRAKIRKMITEDGKIPGLTPGGGGPRDLKMVAGLVRLAFHDCVGKRCDGCINMNNPENAGLDHYINKTEGLYKKLKNTVKPAMTRADFWALAAIEAVQYGAELATCRRCKKVFPQIKFKTGRTDCTGTPKGSPWTDDWHEFPNPLGDTKETTAYFKKMFNFGDMETVAILGAHTLGQAHPTASGFANPWVEQKNRFNNEYYKALLDTSKEWKQTTVGRRRFAKWQWMSESPGGRRTMMLNCDMAMLKNLTDVSSVGEVRGCTYKTCKTVTSGVSNTAIWVKKYAKDNELFLEKFGKAFQKMIRHGYSNLKDVEKRTVIG